MTSWSVDIADRTQRAFWRELLRRVGWWLENLGIALQERAYPRFRRP